MYGFTHYLTALGQCVLIKKMQETYYMHILYGFAVPWLYIIISNIVCTMVLLKTHFTLISI